MAGPKPAALPLGYTPIMELSSLSQNNTKFAQFCNAFRQLAQNIFIGPLGER
jgi:hypothetical protein